MQIILNQTFTGAPKKDIGNHAYGFNSGDIYLVRCKFDANGAAEAIKASRGVNNCKIQESTIIGGVEDCIDFLGCSNILVDRCLFIRGKALRDVTIKGGAHDIGFVECLGLKYIKAGDCTIYEKNGLGPPVRNCYVKADKKVWVLCLNSEPFQGDVINIIIPRIIVRLYFWVRWKFFK